MIKITKKYCIFLILTAIYSSSYAQIKLNNETFIDSNLIDLNNLPFRSGEVRIIDFLDLLPGIYNYRNSSNNFSSFGSPTEQNLITIDNAPLIQYSNFIYNTMILDGMNIYQTTKPSKYYGGISSTSEIRLKTRIDKQKFAGQITPTSMQLTVLVPITNKSNFIFSSNYKFGQNIANVSENYCNLYGFPYRPNSKVINEDYDIIVKYNNQINDKNLLSLTFNSIHNKIGLNEASALQNKNLFSLNWLSNRNSDILIESGISYSNAGSNSVFLEATNSYELTSSQNNFNFFTSIKQFISQKHQLNYGISFSGFKNLPHSLSLIVDSLATPFKQDNQKTSILSANITDNWQPKKWINFNAGIKYSIYNQFGSGKQLDIWNGRIDTLYYSNGDIMKTYQAILPMLKVDIQLAPQTHITIEYESNIQFMHSYQSNLEVYGKTNSIAFPSTNIVKPSRENSLNLILFQNFKGYQFSIIPFIRRTKNLIEIKEGADLYFNEYIDNSFLFGSGESYGIASSFKKSVGSLTGWINYTYTHSTRTFDKINFGESFNSDFVKNHDLSLVTSYNFSDKWNISTIFKYYSGKNVILPTGRFYIAGELIQSYTEDRDYKTPVYYRFDLAINRTISTKTNKHHLSFGLYNLFNINTISNMKGERDDFLYGLTPYFKYRIVI